jgi:hypothetical protein
VVSKAKLATDVQVHGGVHAPATQVCVTAHTAPALPPVQYPLAPQKLASVSGLMQFPLHITCPAAQSGSQRPW